MAKKNLSSNGTVVDSSTYLKLTRPVITEKSTLNAGSLNRVIFKVPLNVAKSEIREAVERIFKVEVAKVRTCRYLGKFKRTNKGQGRRISFKKAYVSLKDGHKIDLVEGL